MVLLMDWIPFWIVAMVVWMIPMQGIFDGAGGPSSCLPESVGGALIGVEDQVDRLSSPSWFGFSLVACEGGRPCGQVGLRTSPG